MGQHFQFLGQLMGRQYLANVGLPLPGAHQALPEPIGLAQLETHIVRRGRECIRRGALRPGRQHTRLGAAEIAAFAAGDGIERAGDACLGAVFQALALAAACIGIEIQALVDNRQVLVIVQIALAGRDLGVDLDPELHSRLQRRRAREVPGMGPQAGQEQHDGKGRSQHTSFHVLFLPTYTRIPGYCPAGKSNYLACSRSDSTASTMESTTGKSPATLFSSPGWYLPVRTRQARRPAWRAPSTSP